MRIELTSQAWKASIINHYTISAYKRATCQIRTGDVIIQHTKLVQSASMRKWQKSDQSSHRHSKSDPKLTRLVFYHLNYRSVLKINGAEGGIRTPDALTYLDYKSSPIDLYGTSAWSGGFEMTNNQTLFMVNEAPVIKI